MGRDVSLILAPGKLLVDVVKAGREPNGSKVIADLLKPDDEYYDKFPTYLSENLEKNDFNKTEHFNTNAGYVATWFLASVKPAWYLRNCSISLFLEQQVMPEEQRNRYITDWASVSKEVLPDVKIDNHFGDANYSLGCLISPDNCRNFMEDYKTNASFKQAVDIHFGIFTAGLLDAISTAVEESTDLLESMDIFGVHIMNQNTGQWTFTEQACYTADTYEETNIALQSFSIEVQVSSAQIQRFQNENNQEKVAAFIKFRDNLIDIMVRNGNKYGEKIRAKTGLDVPTLKPEMWL